jgi:hypothetical protein
MGRLLKCHSLLHVKESVTQDINYKILLLVSRCTFVIVSVNVAMPMHYAAVVPHGRGRGEI